MGRSTFPPSPTVFSDQKDEIKDPTVWNELCWSLERAKELEGMARYRGVDGWLSVNSLVNTRLVIIKYNITSRKSFFLYSLYSIHLEFFFNSYLFTFDVFHIFGVLFICYKVSPRTVSTDQANMSLAGLSLLSNTISQLIQRRWRTSRQLCRVV